MSVVKFSGTRSASKRTSVNVIASMSMPRVTTLSWGCSLGMAPAQPVADWIDKTPPPKNIAKTRKKRRLAIMIMGVFGILVLLIWMAAG